MTNEKSELIKERTNIFLTLTQTSGIKYKLTVKLMNSISIDIILGVYLIQRFDCVLDFSKLLLKIREREVELKTKKTFWRNSPDETLSLKS